MNKRYMKNYMFSEITLTLGYRTLVYIIYERNVKKKKKSFIVSVRVCSNTCLRVCLSDHMAKIKISTSPDNLTRT